MTIEIEVQNKEAYNQILALAFSVCSSFMLVQREQLKFNQKAKNLLKVLEPYFIEGNVQEEWPGTRLMGHYADVYSYKTTQEAMTILKSVSDNFYDWIAPDLLEDLCFFKNDGSVWLISIVHEHEVWITNPTKEEFQKMMDIEGVHYRIK